MAGDSDKMSISRSILKYVFEPVSKKEKDFALPDPSGVFSEQVPSLFIEAANKKVSKLIANHLESSSESTKLCAVKVGCSVFQVLLVECLKNIEDVICQLNNSPLQHECREDFESYFILTQ